MLLLRGRGKDGIRRNNSLAATHVEGADEHKLKLEVRKLWRIRDSLVEGLVMEDKARLLACLRTLSSHSPSKHALAPTGVGCLLGDSSLWARAGDTAIVLAKVTASRWKVNLRKQPPLIHSAAIGRSVPLAGLTAKYFLQCVENLGQWLQSVDVPSVPEPICRRLASDLVLRGFEHWTHLDNANFQDIYWKGASAPAMALLSRAIVKATETGCTAAMHTRMNEVVQAKPLVPSSAAPNAISVASFLTAEHLRCAEEELESAAQSLNATGIGSELLPQQAIRCLSSSSFVPGKAGELLDARVALLQVEVKRKTLPSVISGLKAWQGFAVDILGYQDDLTLPPRSPLDACRFIAIFKNGGTASNYLGYVRWACRFTGVSTSWWDESVTLAVKGLKKANLRLQGGPRLCQFLLTDDIVKQLALLAAGLHEVALQSLILVCSVFLLRVQSEALQLQKGCPQDAVNLPAGRHSAVWICGNTLHIRLSRRKNRSMGSWLQRQCACHEGDPQCCVVHVTERLLQLAGEGCTLFQWTSHQFIARLKRHLALLGHTHANLVTLKSFRAGRATSLAAAGRNLGTILAAGEWRSTAFLRYCQADNLDVSSVLNSVVDEDSD